MKCTMEKKFDFNYKAKLDNDLFEHEFDHVLFGFSNDKSIINPEEVNAYKYLNLDYYFVK